MTQSEMLEILERLREAYQKYRSIVMETDEDDNGILGFMQPWIFGNKCPLRAIQQVLDRGYVERIEFYNFMYILHEITPTVMVCSDTNFPEPRLSLLKESYDKAKESE